MTDRCRVYLVPNLAHEPRIPSDKTRRKTLSSRCSPRGIGALVAQSRKGKTGVAEAIDTVLKCARFGEGFEPSEAEAYETLGVGAGRIVLEGHETFDKIDAALALFAREFPDAAANYSAKTIRARIMDSLRAKGDAAAGYSTGDVDAVVAGLRAQAPVVWTVLHPVFGGILINGQVVTLGPFKVFEWPTHAATAGAQRLLTVAGPRPGLHVAVDVAASESARAYELARIQFRRFENIMRFLIGNVHAEADVGVYDFRRWEIDQHYTVSTLGAASSGTASGARRQVPLDDPSFATQAGAPWLWQAAAATSCSDLQRRVLSAVDWIGKGLRDNDPARSLVQFMFALEALLQAQAGGVTITSSVMAQLAEASAFILGRTLARRLEIERLVKHLYGRRSAVAHGGASAVSEIDRLDALWIVRDVVVTITTDAGLSGLQSAKEVLDWVQRTKYSAP